MSEKSHDLSRIPVSVTNESLDAVIAGLKPSDNDLILAVGGSGEQAFALTEFARLVRVVDIDPYQLQYITERVKMLADGQYDKFFETRKHAEHISNPNSTYFSRDRLERIRSKIGRLQIASPQRIQDAVKSSGNWDKVYLSNILDWGESINEPQQIVDCVVNRVKRGGLIYVANGEQFPAGVQGLVIEDELSSAAQSFEKKYCPKVYKKV